VPGSGLTVAIIAGYGEILSIVRVERAGVVVRREVVGLSRILCLRVRCSLYPVALIHACSLGIVSLIPFVR
jgi:hypothetical protein